MKLQIIKDEQGKNPGVFIPMEDWTLIKSLYPDIEEVDKEVPQWERELIETRLAEITKNPERIKPGSNLLNELRHKI